ncbi:helix-hairpin-helix domain-containing protein, partial [Roseomonas ludipueritiae]|nr:helix-hairpin-helix domain-containing protein [Pseudoroseomonas ludipueritiae]
EAAAATPAASPAPAAVAPATVPLPSAINPAPMLSTASPAS